MDNEKDLLQNEEVTEEEVENTEVLENAEEAAENVDVSEETVTGTEEAVPAFIPTLDKVYRCEACGTLTTDETCPKCQKEMTKEEAYICKKQVVAENNKKTAKIVVIAVLAVAIIAAGIVAFMHFTKKNPYNTGEYKDLAFGQTVGEVANEEGIIYERFLEDNGLPKDMPEDTFYYVALQYKTLGSMYDEDTLKMYGMTVDEAIQQELKSVELDDKGFTKDTLYGEFLGEVKLKYYFGVDSDEDIEKFKEQYPRFKDINMTPETPFKEIREEFYKAEENERLKSLETEDEAEETADFEEEDIEEDTGAEDAVEENQEASVEENTAEVTEEEVPAA